MELDARTEMPSTVPMVACIPSWAITWKCFASDQRLFALTTRNAATPRSAASGPGSGVWLKLTLPTLSTGDGLATRWRPTARSSRQPAVTEKGNYAALCQAGRHAAGKRVAQSWPNAPAAMVRSSLTKAAASAGRSAGSLAIPADPACLMAVCLG
jgi:hypothetical protein